MVSVKQAVKLAGGRGTRLKTLTDNLPKPMISINKRPFLEYLIDLLKENGIEEVVLLLGYLPKKIMEYFGNGSTFGIKIKYSIGDISFETGKRIKNVEELLDNNFLLMYCDNYWPLNLKEKNIDCIIFSLDNWLLSLDERKGDETVRERFQYKKISEAIIQIKKGAKVYSPIYDPKTRKIVRKKSLNPICINEGICIVDGVVASDIKELRNISDFNIFVDVDDNIRKERLMKFYIDYKKCSVDESGKLIKARELEEIPTIKKTMNYADVI